MRHILHISLLGSLLGMFIIAGLFACNNQMIAATYETSLTHSALHNTIESLQISAHESSRDLMLTSNRRNPAPQRTSTRQTSQRSLTIKTSNSTAQKGGKNIDCRMVSAYHANSAMWAHVAHRNTLLIVRQQKFLI